MEFINSLENLPKFEETSVAVGYFDGLHLGHQEVIREAKREAGNKKTIVFSFTTGNAEVIDHGKGAPRLITLKEKARLCEEMGVDYLIAPPFNSICEITSKDFVEKILIEKFQAKSISCGFNFRFGKNALGDGVLLSALCKKNGAILHQISPISYKGEPISTTRIRKDLLKGNIEDVNAMLGRTLSYCSKVVHGEQLGRTLGFPTANEFFEPNQTVPCYGIYAAIVEVDQKKYCAVTSIGIKPTIEGERPPNMETYIEGFSGDLYGKSLRVGLYKRLRSEQKFDSIDLLKQQIQKDAEEAKKEITLEILEKAVM